MAVPGRRSLESRLSVRSSACLFQSGAFDPGSQHDSAPRAGRSVSYVSGTLCQSWIVVVTRTVYLPIRRFKRRLVSLVSHPSSIMHHTPALS